MSQKKLLIRIGKNIDRLRIKRKLTKSYLGDIAGIGKNNIIPIINGKKNPTIATLYKIAEALEVDVKEFFKVPKA